MVQKPTLVDELIAFVPQIGGTLRLLGDAVELGGACAACPLEIANESFGLNCKEEFEVSFFCCPVRGRCPLFKAFGKAATAKWEEIEGRTLEGDLVNTVRPRHGWPVACDGHGNVYENVPRFSKNKAGHYKIIEWRERFCEREVYVVSRQVFPFRIVLNDE
jgi:hypothetical protein